MKAIRKWEWVRNYCIQQSFIGSADIADQIDRVLCYLYGEIDTNAWASNMNARKEGITPEGNIDLSIEAVRHKIVGENPDGSLILKHTEEKDCYKVEIGKGEWTAQTLSDAKQMAIAFAVGVS